MEVDFEVWSREQVTYMVFRELRRFLRKRNLSSGTSLNGINLFNSIG
jgi:hypothetical protein